jgi:NB-ARC domain
MDTNQLKSLLSQTENPKLEFKRKWYSGADALDDKGWGELLKDIIALANGNIGYTGRSAYLIIGADDTDPEFGQLRLTFNIDEVGMLSKLKSLREIILRKLREVCSPPLSEINVYFAELEHDIQLLIIEIPSPIDLLKLDRDLTTRGMKFKKGTVLLRVGQDISVADPTEISVLKNEYTKIYKIPEAAKNKVLHNLPQPDYIDFIGRKDELDRLRNLLHPQDRIWTVVIDGIGGIGKSALALEVAYRCLNEYDFLPQEERFDAIIWTSAKTSVLTAEGVKPRYQTVSTINDICREVSILFGQDGIYRSNLNEQVLLVKRLLGQQRTLLIIDNFETIDDERINAFIRELPSPTKCIVTTRHRIDIADPIRLTAMLREDALSLIRQECEKKKVQLGADQVELLYKRTAGVPLAVVWSIAQISYRGLGIDKVLRRLGDAKGDISLFCFESAIQDIKDSSAYKILISISLSLNSLGRQSISYFSDLSELDCDEGLAILEGLSLINKKSGFFSVISLVRDYVLLRVSLFPFEDLEKTIIRIAENYAPSGADAISLIERFFEPDVLGDLKQRITMIVVGQMWEWDAWYDETGVYYCVSALEKLATDEAISNLKAIANGSVSLYQSQYIYPDVVRSLVSLGKIKDLIELLSTEKDVSTLFIEAFNKFKSHEVVLEIDKYLEVSREEAKNVVVSKLKDIILSVNTG